MKLTIDNLKIYFRTKNGKEWLEYNYPKNTTFDNIINKMLERDYDFKIEYITSKEVEVC